jgi:hypothetical protein
MGSHNAPKTTPKRISARPTKKSIRPYKMRFVPGFPLVSDMIPSLRLCLLTALWMRCRITGSGKQARARPEKLFRRLHVQLDSQARLVGQGNRPILDERRIGHHEIVPVGAL